MAHIIVFAGGSSDEREVSLRSGAAVAKALETKGHQVTRLDPANWPADIEAQIAAADVVFPVLHGTGGEDGTIQQWLADRGKKYVGANPAVSALCFDKWQYKQALQQAGLPVSNGELVDVAGFWEAVTDIDSFVLKPNDGGSSIDTFIIRQDDQPDDVQIAKAFTRHAKMLLEPLVSGTEITIGVLSDIALPVIEIIPPADAEFDYENKYNGETQEHCPPQHVGETNQRQARQLALEIHHKLGIRDLSRTDMIVGPAGLLTVLETNTMPGMTDQSLFPKAALQAGYDMPTLCDMLVHMALTTAETAAS